MRQGKLTNEQLDTLILKKFRCSRAEVLASPNIGVDCAVVDLSGDLAVLSTDPITSAKRNLGRLTVHVSCNDAAAAGAEPIGLLVTLLAPPQVTEAAIAAVADEIAEAAALVHVDIIGGHTEVTESVTRMITCATVIAKAGPRGLIMPNGMRAGDALVLTKTAGLEGTAVIAGDFADRLSFLSEDELQEALGMIEAVSVVKEGLYAAKNGATAMHDVTEGGVLGAAWEMAEASGCGILLERARIPVHPLTQRICQTLGLDPLRLLSSGAMLIACPDGEAMARGLTDIGVQAACIGRAVEQDLTIMDGQKIFPPEADELHRLLSC